MFSYIHRAAGMNEWQNELYLWNIKTVYYRPIGTVSYAAIFYFLTYTYTMTTSVAQRLILRALEHWIDDDLFI